MFVSLFSCKSGSSSFLHYLHHTPNIPSYANVYRGQYNGETVAVKEYTSFSEANNVEAQNFAKFNSLYTVKLYGVCYSLNALVLEYCPYGSIEACYGKPELDAVVKKLACYDLAKAMNYLHESKYIHRDLKPDNLLMVSFSRELEKPRGKLSDFGTSQTALQKTNFKDIEGTPAFLAPEVFLLNLLCLLSHPFLYFSFFSFFLSFTERTFSFSSFTSSLHFHHTQHTEFPTHPSSITISCSLIFVLSHSFFLTQIIITQVLSGSYDKRCDVYSFGLSVWSILTELRPYEDVHFSGVRTEEEFYRRIADGVRPTLDGVGTWKEMIGRCWEQVCAYSFLFQKTYTQRRLFLFFVMFFSFVSPHSHLSCDPTSAPFCERSKVSSVKTSQRTHSVKRVMWSM